MLRVLAGGAGLLAAIPLVYVLVRAGGAGVGAFTDTLLRERVFLLTLNSVGLTLAVTLTSLVLGVATALLLSRFRFPAPRLWILLAALPLAVPSYLAAYGWLVLVPGFQGFFASWLVMAAVCVPYVSLPVLAVLRDSSPELEAVARTLGASASEAFRVATWPRIRSAALSGALLAALYTLSDFGAVSMLRFQTLTWGVKSAYSSSFDRNQAALLATVLMLLALVVVVLERRMRSRATQFDGQCRGSAAVLRRPQALAFATVLIVPVLGVGIPLLGLSLQLFSAQTLRAIDPSRLGQALVTTVLLALAGSVVAVLLALPIALLAARYRGRFVSLVESAGYLGHAVPGIVVGLALVFFAIALVPALYQTVALLIFGYAVLFMSKSIGASRTGFAAVSPSLIDVARTQGYTPVLAWLRVSLRIAAPSIGVGALLVAIAILKELPATLLLRPTGISTLAVELWNRTSVLEYGAAAPYALLLVLVAAVPAFFLSGVRGTAKETE